MARVIVVGSGFLEDLGQALIKGFIRPVGYVKNRSV
jgi:hypothetical protein